MTAADVRPEEPCFYPTVMGWLCRSCGYPRRDHDLSLVAERLDAPPRADRVIAVCPGGRTHGPGHLFGDGRYRIERIH